MFNVTCLGNVPENCMKCPVKIIIEETNELLCMPLNKMICIKDLDELSRYEECPIEVDDLLDWNGEYLDEE